MSNRTVSIRSTLIVAAAIATLGLGAPAFAASYGGFSSDTGICGRHITTRAGGTSDFRLRHERWDNSSLRDLAAACICRKTTGSGTDRVTSSPIEPVICSL
jgi:hypothetical protein